MKTIVVKHPLRDIMYQLKKDRLPSSLEVGALEAYRRAHDDAWRMKLRFERERGEILLVQIDLDQLNSTMEELEQLRNHYQRQLDFSDDTAIADMDIRFKVELRDFYNHAHRLQKEVVKFYDRIGALTLTYTDIVDTYLRGEKPLDPAQFKVLDDVFTFHDDMQITISSLDEDLQGFLQELTRIYAFLDDDYIVAYNDLYTAYNETLQQSVGLVNSVQVFNKVWE